MINPCRLPFKPRILSAVTEKVLGLDRLAQIYDRRPAGCTPHEFLQYTLEALGVTLNLVNASNLEEIPRTGPVLIVANHPLGGLEGVAIAKVIGDIRPDLKVLTNELLRRIPELADIVEAPKSICVPTAEALEVAAIVATPSCISELSAVNPEVAAMVDAPRITNLPVAVVSETAAMVELARITNLPSAVADDVCAIVAAPK